MKNLNTLVFIILTITSTAFSHSFSQIQIVKVDRIVQLNGLYPTETVKIQHQCKIQDCKDELYYAISSEEYEKIAHISFSKDKPTTQSLSYTTQEYIHNQKKYVLYKINIKRRLQASQNYVLVVSLSYLNRYVNYPLKIELSQDQKFQYEDNRYFLSPYHVKDYIGTYKFSKIIGYGPDGEKKGLSTVAFKGSNIQPFTYASHRVHGVNNQPQVYFQEVVRQIQVSHWGNIAITEFYKIKNIGPQLKGQFSRVQFSSNNKFQAKNTWRGIQTNLPYQIWGLYYRDQVGNISTSKAFRDDSSGSVKAAFVPRFGLLGSWKANWEIGYNLNTEGFLTHDGNKFELNKIPFQYALSTILSQKYTIKLILPEGSENVKLLIGNSAVDLSKVSQGISFGYLDFTGRPTFTIDNLKGIFKDQKLKVSYNFDYTSIFKKPIIVFGAIFSVLILFVVLNRLNMSAFQQIHVAVNKQN